MDLIRTLEDDDEVQYESEDDDVLEEDPKEFMKKAKELKTNKKSHEDFDGEFEFVSNQEEYDRDQWKDIAKFIKKKHKTTLDDKIKKIRGENLEAEIKEEPVSEDEGMEVDDDDDEVDDDEDLTDAVRVRENEAKRKERKAKKNKDKDSKKHGVKIEGEAQEHDAEEFFEEHHALNNADASFYNMNLSRPLLKSVEAMNFVHPTPIQAATIPLALAGRDVCGCAATGTGKTAAYMLPVLERLLFRPKESAVTRVLVLVPTRELGVQVFQVTRQLTQFTNIDVGISVGGLDLKMQEASLRKNPDIVIATPGRLIDHLKNTPSFTLEHIEVLILDEADRMLDECFLDQMKEIIKSCARTRQTLLFSATMTDQVQDLAAVSLKKPVKIFVDSNKVVAWNLRQEFVRIRPGKEKNREALLASLVCRTFKDHTMVFIRTKKECHRLHILLGLLGVRVAQLHGNMNQASRLHALKQFKEEEVDVLLTTDVAARGLDISGVKTVINYELPYTIEQYIHRVGRTARAGKTGRSVSLADEEHRKMIREIIKNARNPVKNRVIPQVVIDKFVKKVSGLEASVKKVVEEEQAERELAALEKKTNKMENQLKNGIEASEPERAWFQTTKDKAQVAKNAARKKKKGFKFDTIEEKQIFNEAEFLTRENKRARREKKMRTVYDEDEHGPRRGQQGGNKQGKPKKRMSAFENDITNVGRKNVKRLRHEGSVAARGVRGGKNKQGKGKKK